MQRFALFIIDVLCWLLPTMGLPAERGQNKSIMAVFYFYLFARFCGIMRSVLMSSNGSENEVSNQLLFN